MNLYFQKKIIATNIPNNTNLYKQYICRQLNIDPKNYSFDFVFTTFKKIKNDYNFLYKKAYCWTIYQGEINAKPNIYKKNSPSSRVLYDLIIKEEQTDIESINFQSQFNERLNSSKQELQKQLGNNINNINNDDYGPTNKNQIYRNIIDEILEEEKNNPNINLTFFESTDKDENKDKKGLFLYLKRLGSKLKNLPANIELKKKGVEWLCLQKFAQDNQWNSRDNEYQKLVSLIDVGYTLKEAREKINPSIKARQSIINKQDSSNTLFKDVTNELNKEFDCDKQAKKRLGDFLKIINTNDKDLLLKFGEDWLDLRKKGLEPRSRLYRDLYDKILTNNYERESHYNKKEKIQAKQQINVGQALQNFAPNSINFQLNQNINQQVNQDLIEKQQENISMQQQPESQIVPVFSGYSPYHFGNPIQEEIKQLENNSFINNDGFHNISEESNLEKSNINQLKRHNTNEVLDNELQSPRINKYKKFDFFQDPEYEFKNFDNNSNNEEEA